MNIKLISWLRWVIDLSMTLREGLNFCARRLASASDSPQRDAELLLCHVLQKPRAHLYTWPEQKLDETGRQQLEAIVARRLSGEPIAYILGETEFWSLSLYVDPSTLIPRPDTESLVEVALSLLSEMPAKILDLGTGSGAIALALASERADCQIDAVDRVPAALKLARRNAARHKLGNVRLFSGDWYDALSEAYDMIVANPPYIDGDDPHLHQGDLRFEPGTALISEESGLADLRHIISNGRTYLKPDGWLLTEHGWQQRPAVESCFLQHGYRHVKTSRDYGGRDRVTYGQRP